jgi:hypothetical protein
MQKNISQKIDYPESNSPLSTRSIADNKKFWAAAIILLVTIGFIRMLINRGEALQVDLPAWTSITHLLRTEVIPDQKWFWGALSQREEAGMVLGEAYSLALILPWVLSFLVTPALAIKLACWLAALLLSLGFYFLAVRTSRPLFSFLGALYVFIMSFYNITDGMWYNQFSIALALWFWLALEQYLKQESDRYWILSIFLFTLTIYCHPIGLLGAIAIWASTFIHFINLNKARRNRFVFIKFLSIPVISVMLAAPQIIAIFSSSQYAHVSTNLGHFWWKRQLGLLLNVNLLNKWIQLPLLVFAFFGFIFLWKNKKQTFLTSFVIYLMSISILLRIFIHMPIKIRLLYQLMSYPDRFQFWTQIIYLFWLTVGLNRLFSLITSKPARLRHPLSYLVPILFVSFLIVLMWNGITNLGQIISSGRQITLGVYSSRGEIHGLFDWLRDNIDSSKTRVFYEDTNGTYKWTDDYPDPSPFNCSTHVLALSDIYTKINHVGGWFGTDSYNCYRYRGDGGALFAMRGEQDYSEANLAQNMRLLNCRYLVANSQQVKRFLDGVNFLETIQVIGRFKIYEYRELKPAWAFFARERSGEIKVKKISPTKLIIQVANEVEDNLIVSLAYDKRWKAYLCGQEIPIFSQAGLISIHMNSAGPQEVWLKYEIEKRMPIILVLLGFILIPVIQILSLNKVDRKEIFTKPHGNI